MYLVVILNMKSHSHFITAKQSQVFFCFFYKVGKVRLILIKQDVLKIVLPCKFIVYFMKPAVTKNAKTEQATDQCRDVEVTAVRELVM